LKYIDINRIASVEPMDSELSEIYSEVWKKRRRAEALVRASKPLETIQVKPASVSAEQEIWFKATQKNNGD
jgi:hypothetical protein